MTSETDEALKDWENEERDCNDDLHRHFEQFGRWDWCEITNEARRLWKLMFDEDLEQFSAIDGLVAAVAAQANHGAYCAMAAALGVNMDDLAIVVSEYEENQDGPPAPISAEELLKRIAEAKRCREDECREATV